MKLSSAFTVLGLLLLGGGAAYFLLLEGRGSAGDGGPDFTPLFVIGGLAAAALISFVIAWCSRSRD
ncbi:MAG: hypothetical protein QM755_15865 [Luteolibacter sp.]